jgi:hypothetical protein
MNFNKTGKVFTSKFVGTGPSSYKKGTYWAAVSKVENHCCNVNEYQRQKNNVSGGKARPVFKADSLTAICESIV